MSKKGRPTEKPVEPPSRKFIREYKYEDGSSQKWHYNLDKSPNGPIMVEMFYPEGYFPRDRNENLPKTKRKYLNPTNGKMVAYTRAKELGII